MAKRLTGREKAEQMLRIADTGEYLRDLRLKKGITLAQLSDNVGVSINFLSELERGLKPPSDKLIEALSKFYQVESSEIYNRLGKIPESATDELEKNPQLNKMLSEINQNKKLTPKKKLELYQEMYDVYLQFVEEMEAEKRRRGK
ncbi:helix-turn-helix transcriptional regulator [Heliobacterium chlorum]|uniref:Helix-turn-helix transcriptional regulator n=1 Tax=Heliobacterium chlorum TaxID=2698 RepID=A0ABR7T6P3_HELCL|nr:helix-turn-helix transcriptional regulator [Heliobacterium chlorum]MBC9786439.1 helix-turn-helix transcriptional regulator [Heliobacterium chlorum]